MNCSVEYSCLNSKPLVTFVLFAYNQEEFIQEAVRGVFAQDYRPLEIILSDDCSTDRTFEIMQIEAKSAPDDVDLHLVQSPVNLGIASHINRIFEQVNGEYLVIGAGDDISESNRVSLCINELLKFKRMVLHSKAKKISPDGKDLGIEENPYLSILENAEEIVENMAWVTGATAVIHRNIIENFPKLNKNVVNEDMVWAFRSALKGGSVYINQECVRYRVGVGVSTFRGVGDLVLENQNIRVQLFRSLAVLEQMERDLVSTSTKGTFFEQLHALILKKINQKNACVEFSGSPDLWRGVKMLIRSEWSLDVVKLFMRFLLPSLFSALKSWKSHPRIYCFSQRFSVIETIRRLLLESYVKPESLVFMNQACLRAHESCLRLPLT
ncbi:glycosyltransferase, partial [Candidatus Saccharibacteria bacterium]|nr:glycosyltransferase [Candidatus Saccharibacteria bacterium]